MKKMMLLLLVLPGCFMTAMNQEGIEIVRDQNEKAQTSIVAGLTGVQELVDEINEANEEEREPDLKTPILKIVNSMESASKAVDEAGKTAVTLQEGIGASETTPPQTAAALDAWRRLYAVKAKLYNMAESWLKSQVPLMSSLPQKKKPQPWSTGETAGIASIIVGALTGGGFGGKKLLNKRKKDRADREEAERDRAEADRLVAGLRSKLSTSEFDGVMADNKRLKARLEKAEYEKRVNGDA